MEQALVEFLRRQHPDADEVLVEAFEPIPGGFSRETYRFDAVVSGPAGVERRGYILRKDPPAAAAILHTSRKLEHELLESLRAHTSVPVSRSYGYELDPAVFGEPAMVIERMPGNGRTSDLFHEGPDADQVDDVIRHLCELLAELHRADVSAVDPHGGLADPRGVGIDASSWERYIETTLEYYLNGYDGIGYDPEFFVFLDAMQTLRRTPPRPLPLTIVHGDFNPANFLYANRRVTALIDWENARIGDPREDLGWMLTMDALSNTSVLAHPRNEGGFLAYYNKLTGFEVTPEELAWFSMFATINVAVPVASAIGRRVRREHNQFLHLYMVAPSSGALIGFAQMLGYPGVA